jgi:hypothetical protein
MVDPGSISIVFASSRPSTGLERGASEQRFAIDSQCPYTQLSAGVVKGFLPNLCEKYWMQGITCS